MNYADLVSQLGAYTEDDGELTDEIPNIIDRAEIRISVDLSIDAMNRTATAPVLAGQYWVGKPSGWVAPLHMVLVTGTNRETLEFRTDSFCNEFWPDRTATGNPRYYCNWDEKTFLIVAPFNANATLNHKFEARRVGLSAGTPNTWISDSHPDLLLSACLSGSALFHKSPGNKAMYEETYSKALDGARSESARSRTDATNLWRPGR